MNHRKMGTMRGQLSTAAAVIHKRNTICRQVWKVIHTPVQRRRQAKTRVIHSFNRGYDYYER